MIKRIYEYNDSGCIYLGNWLYIGLIKVWCFYRDNYWKICRKIFKYEPLYGCGFASGKGMQLLEYDIYGKEDRKAQEEAWNIIKDCPYGIVIPFKGIPTQ